MPMSAAYCLTAADGTATSSGSAVTSRAMGARGARRARLESANEPEPTCLAGGFGNARLWRVLGVAMHAEAQGLRTPLQQKDMGTHLGYR